MEEYLKVVSHPVVSPQIKFLLNKIYSKEEILLEEIAALEFTDRLRFGALVHVPDNPYWFLEKMGFMGVGVAPGIKIYQYQIDVIRWMIHRETVPASDHAGIIGGMINLQMGMGKTLITLLYLLMNPQGQSPNLIVVPTSVMLTWKKEFNFFFPYTSEQSRVLFFDNKTMKEMTYDQITSYQIVITTYEVIKRSNVMHQAYEESKDGYGRFIRRPLENVTDSSRTGNNLFYSIVWQRIFIDESHNFTNIETEGFKSIIALKGYSYWCLTGTPMKNGSEDLLSQLLFMGYGQDISEDILNVLPVLPSTWKQTGSHYYDVYNMRQAICTLDYTMAGIQLPPKNKYLITVKTSPVEREVYNSAFELVKSLYNKPNSYIHVLAMIILLRQICVVPFLIHPNAKNHLSKDKKISDEDVNQLTQFSAHKLRGHGGWAKEIRDYIQNIEQSGFMSAKLTAMNQIIAMSPPDEKIIVFSLYSSGLRFAQRSFELASGNTQQESINSSYIDGEIKASDRAPIIDEFRFNPKKRVLFLSTKVGAEGLNLAFASRTINLTPWWNFALEDQAEARVYRTGQTRETHCFSLVNEDTIEEHILRIAQEKRVQCENFIQERKTGYEREMIRQIFGG